MNVVVVESPAKAKTINKYLGKDYRVLASYGHVRDLPPKDGSVDPDRDFAMIWQVNERGEKQIKAIAEARGRIEESLGPAPVAVDEVIRECHVSPAIVHMALLELELAGRLERHPGNRVALIAGSSAAAS